MEMLRIKYAFTVFIIFQNLYAAGAEQHGTLALLKSGANLTAIELWHNSSLSDTSDLYRHRLSLTDIVRTLNTDTYFRSPLIEQWTDLEILWAELNFYNHEGGLMRSYHFEGSNPGDMGADFVETEYLDFKSKAVVRTNISYGPSLYIHQSSDEAYFTFMSMDMASNLASLNGSQFVISASEDFNYFPSAENINCCNISAVGDIIDITEVFQCTYYCLTEANCHFFGIFTDASLGWTRHRCVPLIEMPDTIKKDCNAQCTDNRPCGKKYVNMKAVGSVSADIYSMDSEVYNNLKAMRKGNTSLASLAFRTNGNSAIDMGERLYIGGINVRGPGTYTLLLYDGTCGKMFDLNLNEAEDRYHGYFTGNVQIFDTDTEYTFAPVRARCLYLNSSVDLYDRSVDVFEVTNKFLLADYLVVNAGWDEAICSVMEVMSSNEIIPDAAIEIYQSPHEELFFANGGTYTVPMESYGVVEIRLPGEIETSTDYLSIKASVNVSVTIEVQTQRNCTNQTSGLQSHVFLNEQVVTTAEANTLTHETFDQIKAGDVPTFCTDNFTIIVSALEPLTSSTFNFNLQLFGCRIYAGLTSAYTCQSKNLLESYEAYAEGWVEPRPHLASDALRPGGRGLMLADIDSDVYVNIQLSQYTAIGVRRVILYGTLMTASVDVGRDRKFGSTVNGYPIDVEFADAKSRDVYIYDIQRDYSIQSPYLQLTVEIYACVITRGNMTTLPNVLPGSQTTTEISSTASLQSEPTTPILPTSRMTMSEPSTLFYSITSDSMTPEQNTMSYSVTPDSTTSEQAEMSDSVMSYSTTSEQVTMSDSVTSDSMTSEQTTMSYSVTSDSTTFEQATISDSIASDSTTSEQSTNAPQISTSPFMTSSRSLTTASTNTGQRSTTSQSLSTSNSDLTTSEQTSRNPQNTVSYSVSTGHSHTSTSHQSTNTSTQPNTESSSFAVTTTNGLLPETGITTDATISLPQACRCWNQTRNFTSEELDVIVKDIIKNLTVPVDKTSAFRRTKTSMPDKRRSSALIGAVGIACMVSVGGAVVMMDIDHILRAFNFIRAILSKGLFVAKMSVM